MQDGTVWLSQKLMGQLFGTSSDNIGLHLKNIFKDEELNAHSVTEDFSVTATDGKNYKVKHYNLDAIIAVGYRVNSKRATAFRQWATSLKGGDSGGNNISNENNLNAERDTLAPAIERGNTFEFAEINWRVLDVQDGKALLLSDRVLTSRDYHPSYDAEMTWAKSDMRQYLNSAFLDDTFTSEEEARIAETIVVTNDNPWYGTPGGAQSIDKVFLLSIEEVVQYLGDSELLSKPEPPDGIDAALSGDTITKISDEYDSDRVAYDTRGNTTLWVTQSPAIAPPGYPVCITPDGCIIIGHYYREDYNHTYVLSEVQNVITTYGGVRPALWLIL